LIFKIKRGLLANYLAFLSVLGLLLIVYAQSQGVEGGLDSWNHFLISKCALHHHDLFLDQWNKPLFTCLTFVICQFGFSALILFNIVCVVLSGLLLALTLRKMGYNHTWALVAMLAYTPILFSNTISGLTEPLNVLMLTAVLSLWGYNHLRSAIVLASFLPFVRTEGFVIVMAIALFLLLKKHFRLLPYLLIGSLGMNLLGFAITKHIFWIITDNPYWKQEVEGTFDPGNGSLLHYVKQSTMVFGIPMTLLFVLSNLVFIYRFFAKKKLEAFWLMNLLIFWAYFAAHSLIYYLGILGSHGLTRVMAVIVPNMAVANFILLYQLVKTNRLKVQAAIYTVSVLLIMYTGYKVANYAKPWQSNGISVVADKTQKNFIKAGEWLKVNQLMNRPIIHQSPFFDVYFDKDPYDLKSSYRVWSIDQKNDWAAKGVIVIWDGFSAVREGNMQLSWLANNPNYKILHRIEGFEKPADNPTMYDIVIFEKTN